MEEVPVVLDWMAGTQSLQQAAGAKHMYIGYDIKKDVFSGTLRDWVKNEVMDLVETTPQALLEDVKRVVRERLGRPAGCEVRVRVVLLGMSPCCKIFSKVDNSNKTRGHNYRIHTGKAGQNRPPKDRCSVKGKEAHKADRMVKRGIQVAEWFAQEQGARFYMENPVGSLRKRPYMRQWVKSQQVVQREVDYCAYDHYYMKTTNIWTNMHEWVQVGQTGTGRCEGRCSAGCKGGQGRWEHMYKLSQGSWQAVQGRGRKAKKNMMPLLLQKELLAQAMKEAEQMR